MRVRGSPIVFVLLCALAAPGARARADELVVEGATMGTRYRVRVAGPGVALTHSALRDPVTAILERVDARLSTYREDSELVRFNRQRDTEWWPVSAETAHVARAARDLAVASGGAFDPSVGPLVRLWGFGPTSADRVPPEPDRLLAARAAVGFAHFQVRESPAALRKDRPEVELDLSGIAKGHAVDAVAERLLELGIERFLVEIGGEIRAKGDSPRGGPWIVEIEHPFPDAERPLRVALEDRAIATSGPYRNFVVREGARLSHLLDPRTGAPVASDLVSVSVIAPSAMQADGWATALLVAGPAAGWELAQREQLAALLVSAQDGKARRRATRSFPTHQETPR